MAKLIDELRTSSVTVPLRFIRALPQGKIAAENAVKKYCPGKKSKKMISKIVWNQTKYHISADEYFILNFENLSSKGKSEFIGELEKNRIADRFNDSSNAKYFDDKEETYKKFKDFYKRDILRVKGSEEYSEFLSFAEKNPEFIVKPVSAACGFGVEKVKCADFSDLKEMFDDLLKRYKNDFIAEELIVQSEFTRSFHPESVNTFRITTIRTADRVEIFHPFIRMGMGDSTIDNVSSGGIMGLVDVESGIITDTYSDGGCKYIYHPDTGKQIIGTKVPEWEKAIETAKKLSEVFPENRYVGWDLAYTEKGWIMVEANRRAQMVYQYPAGKGCREEIMAFLKK